MRRLRSATEDEMILCFLRAERASPRWGDAVAAQIEGRWNLLDQPNLRDDAENEARSRILGGYRGYRRDVALFRGFPDDAEWWLVRFTRSEVGNFLFALGIHDELTENTRKVSVAAKNAATVVCGDGSLNESIAALAAADLRGISFAPLIAASVSTHEPLVLIEGYARACAYATNANGADVDAFAGYSSGLRGWVFWGLP